MGDFPAVTGTPDPDLIQTAADFGRALQALRDQSGLKIREVARLTGGQRSTVGGYFSGQHLPLDRELLTRLLRVCGESDPAQVERWQQALARVRRRPRRRAEAPYRGLARYEEADAQWFFGREDVTDLLAALAVAPSELPLLLVGASGAGKSSVLRAGLLPRLDELGWPVAVVDLSVTGVRELTELTLAAETPGLEPPAAGDGRRRAVVVDQFEAVFTLCGDEDERNGLVGALCELARTALVVLALRADFYGHAIRYPRLRQALQERHVVGHRPPHAAGQSLPARDDVRQRDGIPPGPGGRGAPRGRGLQRHGRTAQREHAGTSRTCPAGDERDRGRGIGGVQPGRQAAGHRRGRRVGAAVRRHRPGAPEAAHGGTEGGQHRPHLHGAVRAGRHDARRVQREHRIGAAVAAHQPRRTGGGGAGSRRHGQLPDRAGVHAGQPDAGDRQLGQARVPVERGQPGPTAAARRSAHRAVGANLDGGRQPGREIAGGRRQRRHGLALEPGRSRAPGTDRDPERTAGPHFSVAFSPGGTQLAGASFDDDTVRLWDTAPAAAQATVCANLGQRLTRGEWSSYVPGVPYLAPCAS